MTENKERTWGDESDSDDEEDEEEDVHMEKVEEESERDATTQEPGSTQEEN